MSHILALSYYRDQAAALAARSLVHCFPNNGGLCPLRPHCAPQVFMDTAVKLGNAGRLLHTAGFKYEHAMSASEIMEPKLDSGIRATAKSVAARYVVRHP